MLPLVGLSGQPNCKNESRWVLFAESVELSETEIKYECGTSVMEGFIAHDCELIEYHSAVFIAENETMRWQFH